MSFALDQLLAETNAKANGQPLKGLPAIRNPNFNNPQAPVSTRPTDGRQDDPTYRPGYDPLTMGIGADLQKQLDAIQMDPRGLNKYREEALRDGPSKWAGLADKKSRLDERTQLERGGQTMAGQTAQARGQLAMRGGISSGARRKIASDGARNYLNMSQDVARQGTSNRLDIGINDEQNRVQQLGALPGMEIAALQPQFQKTELWGKGQQFDIGNQIGESRYRNDWEQKERERKDKRAAAADIAGVMRKEDDGGGFLGSFICTELRKHGLMSKRESKRMTELLLKALVPRGDFFNWYFANGESIVNSANAHDIVWANWKTTFVDNILFVWDTRGFDAACDAYASASDLLNSVSGVAPHLPASALTRNWTGPFKFLRAITRKGVASFFYGYFKGSFERKLKKMEFRRAS